mgnify:CR=1 FL=1
MEKVQTSFLYNERDQGFGEISFQARGNHKDGFL